MTDGTTGPLTMRVADVRRTAEAAEPERTVVVLQEIGGDRRLPIWVGPFEGTALALHLRGVTMPRPDTHHLTLQLLAASAGRLGEVVITALVDGAYHAEVVVDGPAGTRTVDARPSDAINLALAAGVAIRAHPRVFEQAAAVRGAVPDDLEAQHPRDAATIAAEVTAAWEEQRRWV